MMLSIFPIFCISLNLLFPQLFVLILAKPSNHDETVRFDDEINRDLTETICVNQVFVGNMRMDLNLTQYTELNNENKPLIILLWIFGFTQNTKTNGIILLSITTILSVLQPYSVDATNWTLITSPPIPNEDRYRAIGYDSNNHLVWMLGGWSNRKQVISFDTINGTYTDHEAILSADIWCATENYVQKDSQLYIAYDYQLYKYHLTNIASNLQVLSSLSVDGVYGCLSVVDNYLILTRSLDVFIYNINNNTWINPPNTPSMSHYRLAHSCKVSSSKQLYVVGGRNDSSISINSIEKLDVSDITNIKNFHWILLTDTLSNRKDLAVSVIFNDVIYVIGGWKEPGGPRQDGVDVIHTKNDTVSSFIPIYEAKYGASAVMISRTIYVFGGQLEPGVRATYYQYYTLATDNPTTDNPTTDRPTTDPTRKDEQIQETNKETTSSSTTETATATATDAGIFKIYNTVYMLLLFVIAAVFILCAIVGFLDATLCRKNDFFSISAIITCMFQVFDLISDIFLALNIANRINEKTFFILFILSLFFIILPIILSIFQLSHQINKHWMRNDNIKQWLVTYITFLYFLSIFSGSSFTAIKLMNSNLLNLEIFSMDLSKNQLIRYQIKRVYSIILTENLPQLILQCIYLWQISGLDGIVLSSMVFSSISIIVTIISMITGKQLLDSSGCGIVEFEVYGSSIIAKSDRYRNMTKEIRNQLSSILGLNNRLIEVLKPNKIPNAIKITVHIHSNHILSQNIDYKKLLIESHQNGQLAEIIKKSWNLNKIPVISSIHFKMKESKDRIKGTVPIKIQNESQKQMDNMMNVELVQTPKIKDTPGLNNVVDGEESHSSTINGQNTTKFGEGNSIGSDNNN